MARKYNNFRVGGSPQKVTDDYAVWTMICWEKS